MVRIDPIRGIQPRQRFLSDEELTILLAKAQEVQDWLPDFILWQLHSGMRKGETQQLAWSDVRRLPDDKVIVQVKRAKGDKFRTVVATETMKSVLSRQWNRRVEGDERVFPVSKMTLRRRWEKARREAGLEEVSVHDLRRTNATHAAVAGIDLRTLAGRIGHSDLSMLEKHYAALVGTAAEEAADKIEATFASMSGNEGKAD